MPRGIRYSTGSSRLVIRLDRDALLVLVVLAELDGARDLREDRVILRTPGLEQFRNARQTAGNVARLRRRRRNTGQNVARLHFRAAIDRQHGLDRQQVTRIAAARDLDRLALAVLDHDRGLQLGAARRRTPVDDDAVRRALHLVGLLAHRGAFDQVLEVDRAVGFRENRTRIGIPLRDLGAALHGIAFVDEDARAIADLVGREFLAGLVDDDDRHDTAHGDVLALRSPWQWRGSSASPCR